MVSVHLCVLHKISFRDPLAEIRIGKKPIILTIDLTGTWRSRRTRDGVEQIRGSPNPFHQCGLARARWSRNHKKNSAAAEFFTQDFGLARESSPARTCRR
jgi:hypothetical protein